MANSQLYNKTYQIPPNIIQNIRAALVANPTGNGVKRAKFMLNNGRLTYQAMKRLKNFFDYFNSKNGDAVQYNLAGGKAMHDFVNSTLNTDRAGVKMGKQITQPVRNDMMLGLKAYQTPRLNEDKNKLNKNAIAVIVNDDNKFLLLKRANVKDIWMPGKWALVGGAIEKGERPEAACKREIYEETGLNIDEFNKRFTIQRNPDSIEYVFACRYSGDIDDITLNEENTNYGWYDINEMKFLDVVPNLIDYVSIAFKKYD